MPDYALGSKPPAVTMDVGSGAWCSAPQTSEYLLYKRSLELALSTGAVDITIGPDAVAHMRHYMDNTGSDLQLNMLELLRKSNQLREKLDLELKRAKAFSETLAPGRYDITSTKTDGGYFRQAEGGNLFFAIGGYSFWGQGKLRIEPSGAGKLRYTLDFEFHFFDRYNWDGGKSVTIVGIEITDRFMQQFHKQCYAREYNVKGIAKQQLVWENSAVTTLPPAPPRQRNPFDILKQP